MKQLIQKRWSTDQLITGIELQDWVRLLAKNGWKVEPSYFHRAAWVGAWAVPATVFGRIEDATYGKELATMDVRDPLFILGHWRSGTTHLHNLLARDTHNTTSTTFQCVFPTSFLTLDKLGVKRMTAGMLDETRTYDNVKFGWDEAAEDEIALAKLTGLSPYIAFMFPDNAPKYEKYVDFLSASEAERRKWRQSFIYLLKKIQLATGNKNVVIKSCTHSARIRLLLDMFPNAKFIHIHRNPYECFASTLHMRSHTDWENFFHLPEEDVEGQRARQTAALGRQIFERMIEDRHMIPPENYYEIAYEQFVGNELTVLRDIYSHLRLPGWDEYERGIKPYLEGLKGYKRNKLNIDQSLMDLVYNEWKLVFDTYGYPREYGA